MYLNRLYLHILGPCIPTGLRRVGEVLPTLPRSLLLCLPWRVSSSFVAALCIGKHPDHSIYTCSTRGYTAPLVQAPWVHIISIPHFAASLSLSLYTYNIKAIFGASFRQYQMVKFFMNEHADIVSCIIWLKHMKTLTWNLLCASWALTVGEVFHCIICTGLSLSTKRKFLYATWISAPSS